MFHNFKICKSILMLSLVCQVVSCGKESSPDSELSAILVGVPTEGRTPVVITFGGWNSCSLGSNWHLDPIGAPIWEPAKNFRSQVEQHYGQKAQWMVLCYSYYKSSASGKGRYLSDKNPTSYKRASPLETTDFIRNIVQKTPNADVYIIGYSYGGWMAMKTVESLGGSMNIPLVATLDPISQNNCNMFGFVTNWISGGYDGCKEFPADFSTASLQKIQDDTGAWLNYYQLDYPRLHSGISGFADVDRQLLTTYRNHGAHTVVVSSPGIWHDQEGTLAGQTPTSSPIQD